MEIIPDHVQLLLDCPLKLRALDIIKTIKQSSAVQLKQEFPILKTKSPNLWTRSAFVSTVGATSLDVVKQYIEHQKEV